MPRHVRIHARQVDVPAVPSDIVGVSGGLTLDPNARPTGIAFATSVATGLTQETAPPLAGAFTPTVTESTETVPTGSSTPTSGSGATHTISLGAVVGACAGAFVGACLIILFSVWFYRRSTRAMISQQRRGDPSRQKESWKQIKDDEDEWRGGMTEMNNAKSSLSRSPTEKIGVFKKSPSMRTTSDRTSRSDMPAFEPQTFASYHPNLALEMAGAAPASGDHVRPNGEEQVASWDGNRSLMVSLRSERAASGSLSPSLTRTMSTPVTVMAADAHHWQSAEVVTMEGSVAATDDDHQSQYDNPVNPFFSSKEREYMLRAKENSKGKRKEENPFVNADEETATPHNDAAIQSIIAALKVPPSPTSPIITSPTGSTDSAQYIRPLPSPPQA